MSNEPFAGIDLPEDFNLADHLLDARIREGKAGRIAIITDQQVLKYSDVHTLANKFANVLCELGVEQENRVLIALPDIPEYAAALFGILKMGAVVVMINPQLKPDDVDYFLQYSRAKAAIVSEESFASVEQASHNSPHLKKILTVGMPSRNRQVAFEELERSASSQFQNATTHRDDPAIWLFSGGTTGRPKAVVQTHLSFANTTECYGKKHLEYCATDRTLSVPKLFFGYATGSNLFFPFSVGAASILFPEKCTPEVLFEKIRRHRPTILINVPTMVNQMVNYSQADKQDLSCLRFATSAGEALPVELYERWKKAFNVELLDGLGTAEMWHIFISNKIGETKPGTVGKVVPGFEVKAADDEGKEVADDEIGMCWVRGRSRAIGYWQNMEKTSAGFRGDWYVTGDL
ncbi:MAG TPA: AMP-binding protein, partial [Acidobacteriota bacterium]